MDRPKHYIAGNLAIFPIVCSLYSGGTRTRTVQRVNHYLHVYKMVIKELEFHILQDAVKENLLPTALISKYDVTLDRLMHSLRSLLSEGYIELTEGKWIRITEKGRLSVTKKEEEQLDEIDLWKSSYIEEFFSRSSTVQVNEPCLPSIEGIKKIMEGEGQRETSN